MEKPKEITVEIFNIKTPKCGYFVFYKDKRNRIDLNVEPFKIKEGDQLYPYKHHMCGEDLLYFKKYNKNIVLYDNRYKTQSWEDTMKYEIYSVINSGLLNRPAQFYGKEVFVKFVWSGEKVPKSIIEIS